MPLRTWLHLTWITLCEAHLEVVHRVFPSINVDMFHCPVHRDHCHSHVQSSVDFVLLHVRHRATIAENPFLQYEKALNVTQEDASHRAPWTPHKQCMTHKLLGPHIEHCQCMTHISYATSASYPSRWQKSFSIQPTTIFCRHKHAPCETLSEAIFSSSKENLEYSSVFPSPPPHPGEGGCRSPKLVPGLGAEVKGHKG